MITWYVQKLECFTNYNDTSNVVYSISWRVQASRTVTEKQYNTFRYGKTDIILSDGPYIQFDDLTQELTLSWLYNRLGNDKQAIELDLEKELDELANPVKVTLTPPWE